MSDEDWKARFEELSDMMRLDEFQRVAAYDLLRDLEGTDFSNPTPEQEKKTIELGRIVNEALRR